MYNLVIQRLSFKLTMRCFLCHMPLKLPFHGICSQCLANLPKLGKVCRQCGLPHALNNTRCYRCHKKPNHWDELIAVSDYVYPLKKMIPEFKFHRKVELTVPLARLMFLAWYQRRLQCGIIKPDIMTCVPLHPIRYWSRGFNQAERLAKPLAKWINKDFYPHLLYRHTMRRDQKRLTKHLRELNVKTLFGCDKDLTGKSILLIDDIVTTGHTINAISDLLKKQGASYVQIICLCRTVL